MKRSMTRSKNPITASRGKRRQSECGSRLLLCLFLFALLGVAVRMALMDVRGNMMIRSSPCGWFRPRCCREVDLLMVLVPLRLDDLEEGAEGLPPIVTTADFRCSVTILPLLLSYDRSLPLLGNCKHSWFSQSIRVT